MVRRATRQARSGARGDYEEYRGVSLSFEVEGADTVGFVPFGNFILVYAEASI